MNITTNPLATWLNQHPRLKEWAWFITLWFAGLFAVLAISYPIKLIIHA